MKTLLLSTILFLSTSLPSLAQSIEKTDPQPLYTNVCHDKKLQKKAKKWLKKGQWRQGFTGAAPHESVNIVDFYLQYQKNPEQWTKLFKYLSTTDLLALPKGKHAIPDSDLTISVEDSHNEPLEKRNSESHFKGIDFQYCVKGTERFGIIDHTTSTIKSQPKNKDVVHYNYDKSRTLFYDSTPDRFFIFFPGDWHIAKVNNDSSDQQIRVCVVKLRWVE